MEGRGKGGLIERGSYWLSSFKKRGALNRGFTVVKKSKKCLRPTKTVRFTSWTIDNIRVYYSVVFVKHSFNNKRETCLQHYDKVCRVVLWAATVVKMLQWKTLNFDAVNGLWSFDCFLSFINYVSCCQSFICWWNGAWSDLWSDLFKHAL